MEALSLVLNALVFGSLSLSLSLSLKVLPWGAVCVFVVVDASQESQGLCMSLVRISSLKSLGLYPLVRDKTLSYETHGQCASSS